VNTERRTLLLLGLVVLLTAWLRIHNLGLSGLERNEDEDIMAAAVLGIAEHGYPLMPSGMIYARSGPLLYVMAGSASVFGLNEFALRLGPAIFGILLVPLGFLAAYRFDGRTTAIAVAVLIALSLWQVEVSRTARMYAPFAFLYLLSVYGVVRGYIDNVAFWRWLSIPLAMLAITVHVLGFTLAVVFLAAALLPRVTMAARMLALGGAVLTAATYAVTGAVTYRLFARPWAMAAAESSTSGTLPTEGGASLAGLLETLYQSVSSRLYLPPHPLFGTTEGVLVLLVLGVACAILGWWLFRRWPALRRPLSATLLVVSLLAAVFHQFGMAALLFGGLVFVHGPGIRALTQSPVVAFATVLLAVFVLWFMAGISGVAAADSSLHGVARSLLEYPRTEAIRDFGADRPLLTVLAGVGMIAALHQASVERRMTPIAFLALAVVLSLTLHGVFRSQFRPRYNFNLDVPFLIFVVTGSLVCIGALSRYGQALIARLVPRAGPGLARVALTLLLTLAIALDVRAWASPAYPSYWEGSSPAFVERFGFPAVVDRRSPARYVAEHMEDGDRVVAMDWLTTYVYLRRVDYWSRTTKYESQAYEDDGVLRDLYLGAEILPDAQSLHALIDSTCRPTLWMVTSANIIRHGSKTTPEVMALVASLEPYRVYTGLDGISAAYRLPGQDVC
jgi:4-amino-4-deoxy-L-arabinose transferase-like glycosyltransferase